MLQHVDLTKVQPWRINFIMKTPVRSDTKIDTAARIGNPTMPKTRTEESTIGRTYVSNLTSWGYRSEITSSEGDLGSHVNSFENSVIPELNTPRPVSFIRVLTVWNTEPPSMDDPAPSLFKVPKETFGNELPARRSSSATRRKY